MRLSTIWPVLILALSNAAFAQSKAPSDAPPKLDKIDEIDTPITVTNKPKEKAVTEKRDNSGRVTEVKVKSGPSTYTVKPKNTATSTALPGDAAGMANRGPQWTVMEFDLGKKKTKQKDDDAAADDAPPPPKK
ncbi:hypothetical protein GCM10027277_39530 [Pseudoduganella ginsengisoli]|uniref:DUF2782 domain-containing protein n=1 Tax=Pseudoduganella ginsengisoli TaxID=1462440 RepID=A0A6L6PWQ3_9BURK|nr:hypothetical protein [Pseudoduganella ginsengisoli]MTW01977.1 hypothetical protein [Pseudoduganella ginsengisoli]